jgi:hypothetical protein
VADIPDIRSAAARSIQENRASELARNILNEIQEYDVTLDNAHEVGVRLVSFGQTVTFHLKEIGYIDPSLIVFTGKTNDGDPVELMQHVSQISILLMKLPRQHPETPKKPIGFYAASAEEKDT